MCTIKVFIACAHTHTEDTHFCNFLFCANSCDCLCSHCKVGFMKAVCPVSLLHRPFHSTYRPHKVLTSLLAICCYYTFFCDCILEKHLILYGLITSVPILWWSTFREILSFAVLRCTRAGMFVHICNYIFRITGESTGNQKRRLLIHTIYCFLERLLPITQLSLR